MMMNDVVIATTCCNNDANSQQLAISRNLDVGERKTHLSR